MHSTRALLVSLAAVIVALPPARVAAQAPDAVSLSWTAPDGCRDAEAFDAAFREAVGAPLADVAAPGTQVRVRYDGARRWAVTIEVALGGIARTRTLAIEGGDCAGLDDGLVVVIALLVEEAAAAARPADATPTAPPPIVLPAPVETASTLRGALALGALARIDALPGLAGGAILHMEIRAADIVTVGLGAAYFPSASARRDAVGADVTAVGGLLSGCLLALPATIVELGGCASVDAFLVSAAGSGLPAPQSSAGLELDVVAEVRGAIRIAGPLWLRLMAGIGVALVRARIYFDALGTAETLHLTSIAFPTAAALLEVRLGE